MASTALSAQGSTLQIATGTGGAKTITAIAVGNPTNNSTLGANDVQIDAYMRDYPAVDALSARLRRRLASGSKSRMRSVFTVRVANGRAADSVLAVTP